MREIPTTRVLGAQAEKKARDYLEQHGYRILEINYRCRRGEIDIIAEEGEVLCFVEVRSLSSTKHGHPLETITRTKQRRILWAAQVYLQTHQLELPSVRFDVIGIVNEVQQEI